MILCQGPSDKIQVVTGSAALIDCHVSAMDYDGVTAASYRKNTAITTAATTDIAAAPASGVTRNIKTINIRNKDVVSCQITVRTTDGTTTVELFSTLLAPGQTLSYVEGIGWSPAISSCFAVVANTVAGLGVASDGAMGRIRAGGLPYDFIDLIYDATYGKWVSATIGAGGPYPQGTLNSTGYTDLTVAVYPFLLWRVLSAAGLTPQIRARVSAGVNAGANTSTLGIALAGNDAGAVASAFGTEFGDTSVTQNANSLLIDTGWQTPSGGSLPAVADCLAVKLRGKVSSTSIGKTWTGAQAWLRWVG